VNVARSSPDRSRILTVVIGSLVLLAAAGTSFAQVGPARLEIKDSAGMFSKESIERARKLYSADSIAVPVTIETIERLDGQTIEEATRRHAEKSGSEGVYVLISRSDHKIDVLVSNAYVRIKPDRERIQLAFIDGLRGGEFDSALLGGMNSIVGIARGAGLVESQSPGTTPAERGSASALVLRNQVRLTLAGARRIQEGAQKKAVAMGLKVNIAVVDDGGHMIAFERMDGARPASAYTATTKAITAATFRAPSGPIPPGTTTPDLLLNLSLQNAAAASGGKLTTLPGGIPVVVEGQVIGAVGVGGGTGEQDATIARAGIEAFEAALKSPAEAPKEAQPTEK
jgi:glc operon protein GlcG